MDKELLGIIASLFAVVAYVSYIFSIMKGVTKPHVFSWVIWALGTFVVFLAQLVDGGGAGAWSIGVSGILCIIVAWFAYCKKAEIIITRTDWFFFVTALAALPFWYVTSNPLWAVVIITSINFIAFIPTMRKVYHYPFEEPLFLAELLLVRNIITIAALEHYSLTTLLFPVVISVAHVIFIGLVVVRRRR